MPKSMQSRDLNREISWVCQTQQHVGDESALQCCQYQAHKGEGPNHAFSV